MLTITSLSQGNVVGATYSFTSKVPGERPFRALPNRRFASVTTLIVSHRFVIFSVSVVSESEPDENYRAAIDAFRNLE
jgi:hypothetical protein